MTPVMKYRTYIYMAVAMALIMMVLSKRSTGGPVASDLCMIEQAKITSYTQQTNRYALEIMLIMIIVMICDMGISVLVPVLRNAIKKRNENIN